MAEDEKKCNDFIPTTEQIAIVELLINPDDLRSTAKKCEAVGISPITLWRWRKDPDFCDYMKEQLGKYTNSAVTDSWMALMRNVKMGKEPSIKLFFEMTGQYSEKKKVEHTGLNGGPLTFKWED